MADSEILAAIKDEAFKPLCEYTRYQTPEDAEVIAYVESHLNKEIYSQTVSHYERPLLALTDGEFIRMEEIKTKVPCAKVEPVQRVLYCDDYNDADDPELCVNVVRVTLPVGALEFSRDYLLGDV